MPDETVEVRLALIQECIDEATRCLAVLRSELGINSRIEQANTREIEKLKHHVAELQSQARAGTNPTPMGTPSGN